MRRIGPNVRPWSWEATTSRDPPPKKLLVRWTSSRPLPCSMELTYTVPLLWSTAKKGRSLGEAKPGTPVLSLGGTAAWNFARSMAMTGALHVLPKSVDRITLTGASTEDVRAPAYRVWSGPKATTLSVHWLFGNVGGVSCFQVRPPSCVELARQPWLVFWL